MPPISLSGLPPELLSQIFSSLDTFSDIVALSSTSKQFQHIWRDNIVSISNAVRPKAIQCFEDAKELLEVQGKLRTLEETERNRKIALEPKVHESSSRLTSHKEERAPQETRSRIRNERRFQAALTINKLLIANAKKVTDACNDMETWMNLNRRSVYPTPRHLKKAHMTSLTHQYYRTWILAETKESTDRLSHLKSLPPSDLERLRRVVSWLKWHCTAKSNHAPAGWKVAFDDIMIDTPFPCYRQRGLIDCCIGNIVRMLVKSTVDEACNN